MELVLDLIILVFSAIFHEVAHGYVADRLGDPTARLSGRLTLDPRKHVDPMMSIVLPLLLFLSGSPVLFGGAKPVPIDEFNLKEGRKDIALVALAGPLTNVLLAVFSGIVLRVLYAQLSFSTPTVVLDILLAIMHINLALAVLNLLPIPPLDGSKVFSLILPDRDARAYMSLSTIGMVILFLLLIMPIGGFSLQQFITNIINFAQSLLLP